MTPVIVITGRPNVGKSTLFNRLSRSRTALVDDRPGITRDRLYKTIDYQGTKITIVDTGGFDDTGRDPLLDKMNEQIEAAIGDAERLLFLVDARQGLMPGDTEIAAILRKTGKKVFLAANKIDSPEHEHLASEFHALGLGEVYPLSSAHGYGLRDLMDQVVEGLEENRETEEDRHAIRVAVVGRPNAGKSSLINRMLGTERLVVSDIPGTTRDAVDTPFSYGGRDYILVDTAGIRRKARVREKIDRFSMIKAVKSLDRCHVAVVLIDAVEGITEQDARICGYAFDRGRGLVTAVNKWDLVKRDEWAKKLLDSGIETQLKFMPFAPRINVSALTGEKVTRLFQAVNLVYDQMCARVGTGILNRIIQHATARHAPPRTGGGTLKFYYATQTETIPPTFTLFVNNPKLIHFSYERFITNQLREECGLQNSPIRLIFKKR
ncbi:MAG TPA: ribosome biogenesis GTPase Der [Desulfobacteraceae bacterium]|nr:ribosome biogenesis GTPase Der [Desulfobacteraceae bacterium]